MKSKITKGMLMSALVCGFVYCGAVTVHAQELEEFVMDEFVVTASRVATSKADTPANISVLTAETLAEKNYSSVQEALADVPSVNILGSGAKGTITGQDSIMINGDERVLVLIDGRRMNVGSSGKSSATWLPPVNAIERVEVLKGGGSALYGSDAVGGVINIITKKGSEAGSQVTLRAVGGSWNTEEYGLTASGSNDKGLGVFIAANKERRGNYDYKNDSGDVVEMKNSGYNTEGVNIKLDQTVGDDDRISFAFEHNNSKGGAPFGDPSYKLTDRYERLNNNVSMRYDWNETADNQGYVQVYKNYQHAHFISVNPYCQSNFTDETVGFSAQQNLKLDEKNELTAGSEYYKTSVDNGGFYGGKHSIENKALFAEYRYKFDDSWQLNSGLRYDKHNMFGSEVTPKIALNKKLNEDSNVYLSWGKVFNAPSTDKLYSRDIYMLGNPDLKPEKGDVWTLGGNTKLGAKTDVSASLFYSEIDDAISWDEKPSSEWQAENLNKEKRRGLEISISHEFDEHFDVYASYAYMQIKQDEGKGAGYERHGNEKPNTYRAGLKYKNAGWIYSADLTAVTGQKVVPYAYRNSEAYGYTDSNYFILDLGAQYKVNQNLKVFANIYNLTDARYQELGGFNKGVAYYPMPSRSFIIGAEYSF